MDVTVTLRHIRISPDKIRLVADLIRGKSVQDADVILIHCPKAAARPLRKLIALGIADADHNFKLDPGNLKIKTILVDAGVTMKRFRPRAFGRAAMIRKRASHVKLVLTETKAAAKTPVKAPVVKKEPVKETVVNTAST